MASVLTQAHKDKMQAAKTERLQRNQQSRSKGLTIGKWRVYRFDDMNVAVDKEGELEDKRRYYPDFPTAAVALFRLIAEPSGKQSAGEYVKTIEAAEAKILKAVEGLSNDA